jgi:hypothetical protein
MIMSGAASERPVLDSLRARADKDNGEDKPITYNLFDVTFRLDLVGAWKPTSTVARLIAVHAGNNGQGETGDFMLADIQQGGAPPSIVTRMTMTEEITERLQSPAGQIVRVITCSFLACS